MTKLVYLFIFSTTLLASCEKISSKENLNSQSTSSSIISNYRDSSVSIEGYKDLKFGMSPVELAKTETCAANYNLFSGITNYESIVDSLRKSENIFSTRYTSLIKNENHSLARLDELMVMGEATKAQTAKRIEITNKILELEKKQIEVDEAQKEKIKININDATIKNDKAKAYDVDSAANWAKEVFISPPLYRTKGCLTTIMGLDKTVKLLFTQNSLSGISIELGKFDNDTYMAIEKDLSKKYAAAYIPTDAQIASFNNGRIYRIAHTYSNNQVVLAIDNYKNGTKIVNLYYLSKNRASEYSKTITQGVIASGDL
ncbi:MAG: hypothetical protein HHJ15_17215 [Rhodoferax sp.]|uniref:hypothetical protein n=1 Tax=Rhodoferax sp. TaxID=50421 RepID=UPI0018215680|nr:hypothetical protein [Rhodoferax sp.]NMM21662.1 hypothetical protein [Rhodoferax sp.]